jgi:hypothetical protein
VATPLFERPYTTTSASFARVSDESGTMVPLQSRASGQPRKADLIAALGEVT